MRLIDADALIERKCKTYAKGDCKHCTFWGDTWCDCNLTGMDLNNAPTLTQPNEWVNVEERLPENYADVLMWSAKWNIAEAGSYYNGWFWVHNEVGDAYIADNITYWMPLPEPPDRCPPKGEK